jgi:hypothetical protein
MTNEEPPKENENKEKEDEKAVKGPKGSPLRGRKLLPKSQRQRPPEQERQIDGDLRPKHRSSKKPLVQLGGSNTDGGDGYKRDKAGRIIATVDELNKALDGGPNANRVTTSEQKNPSAAQTVAGTSKEELRDGRTASGAVQAAHETQGDQEPKQDAEQKEKVATKKAQVSAKPRRPTNNVTPEQFARRHGLPWGKPKPKK